MPTNNLWNLYPRNQIGEQSLIEDLIIECIRIQGMDVQYLPRESLDTTDQLFGENLQSYFERAYTIEMYMENTGDWNGQSEFFSRFGVGQDDNASLVVAKRTFERYVPSNITIRPREGDLIYIPVLQKIFEITFVEEDKAFYVRGSRNPYVYGLTLEAYRTSNEVIKTGIDEIDSIDDTAVYTQQLVLMGEGAYDRGERIYVGDNVTYSTASAKVSNWDGANNTIYVVDVQGIFHNGDMVTGNTTDTQRIVYSTETLSDYAYYDIYDNKQIQDEANSIIDLSETNPFGSA